jgi:TPR repeat protein
MTIVHIARLAALLCLAAAPVLAQDFQDGVAAAKRGDFHAAMQVWEPLAENGDAASQYNLGMLYARGDGVDEDLAEAARWFRRAAERGQVDAQARLGGMYARGLGVEKDRVEAARWLRAAAEQHHTISQYELGVLHANGDGVPRDPVAAYFWFTLASRQGFPPAMKAQIRLRQSMGPSQTGAVELRVDDWLKERLDAAPAAPGG